MVELPFHAADYDGTVSLWGVPSPVILPREHSHRSSVFLPSKMRIVIVRCSSHWVPVELPRKLIFYTVEHVIKNICPVNYFKKNTISFYYFLLSNFERNLDYVFCTCMKEQINTKRTITCSYKLFNKTLFLYLFLTHINNPCFGCSHIIIKNIVFSHTPTNSHQQNLALVIQSYCHICLCLYDRVQPQSTCRSRVEIGGVYPQSTQSSNSCFLAYIQWWG